MPLQGRVKELSARGIVATVGVSGQQSAADAAREYVTRNRQQFGLTGSDTNDMAISSTTLVPTGVTPAPLDSPGATGLTQNGTEFHVNWKTQRLGRIVPAGNAARPGRQQSGRVLPLRVKHVRSSLGTET